MSVAAVVRMAAVVMMVTAIAIVMKMPVQMAGAVIVRGVTAGGVGVVAVVDAPGQNQGSGTNSKNEEAIHKSSKNQGINRIYSR